MMRIGFIGTGVMGSGIIANLLKHDYDLVVYNRTKEHAKDVLNLGAKWADSPAQVARASDVVMTMVGFPQDVVDVYCGQNGVMKAVKPNQLLIDLTTSKPSLAQNLAAKATQRGAFMLDAPVSGGDIGAQKGTLTVMVGGDRDQLNQHLALFHAFGQTVRYFGPAGSGQHAKMANQIMIAGTMTGMCECLAYAKAAHLKLDEVLATVNNGAAANWSLANYGPRILKDDYTPGFFVKHFVKDLRIALDEAAKIHLQLPATDQAKRLYEQLMQQGDSDDGTQALIKLWWK